MNDYFHKTQKRSLLAGIFCWFASAGMGPLLAGDLDLGQGSSEMQCLADLAGTPLTCTGGADFSISIVAANVLDACQYIGDTATFEPVVNLVSNASRYDIVTVISLDGGDAVSGSCRADVYPEVLSVNDLDLQAEDTCGDLPGGSSGTDFQLTSITIPCRDRDQDGAVDLEACAAWSNNGSDICQVPSDLSILGSRCTCSLQNVVNLYVPLVSVEVKKQLDPPTDNGLFDLLVNQQPMAFEIGDGGTTGPIEVVPLFGAIQVGEVAADGTTLANYVSSIECLDQVGRCSQDASERCITDQHCSSQAAGTCDFTPTLIAGCTDCTHLDLPFFPFEPATVQCSITNTAAELPGQILIVKQTIPDGDPSVFQFTANFSEDDFGLSDGQQHSSGNLVPGTYEVSEDSSSGWILESASCSDGSEPSAIMLAAGEEITCTFYNLREDIHDDGFEDESS